MDYRKETMDIFDQSASKQYREKDDHLVGHGSRQHYCEIVRELSGGFGKKINVLDVGCGTGRYFHCLRNVKRLMGIDISAHMLDLARDPVKSKQLDVEDIELRCGDIYSLELPDQSFDLIYSIGVVGEYSPINNVLLDKLSGLLAPKGKLFFTVVDVYSRFQLPENKQASFTRRALRKFFPLLPPFAKKSLNRALSSFYVTDRELTALLRKSQFATFNVSRFEHPSGWQGAHLDCLAEKHDKVGGAAATAARRGADTPQENTHVVFSLPEQQG
jgi:SAM-dependent methyltransferase